MSNFAPGILAMQLRTKTRLEGESQSQFIDRLLREREDAADCIEELDHRVVKLDYQLEAASDQITEMHLRWAEVEDQLGWD